MMKPFNLSHRSASPSQTRTKEVVVKRPCYRDYKRILDRSSAAAAAGSANSNGKWEINRNCSLHGRKRRERNIIIGASILLCIWIYTRLVLYFMTPLHLLDKNNTVLTTFQTKCHFLQKQFSQHRDDDDDDNNNNNNNNNLKQTKQQQQKKLKIALISAQSGMNPQLVEASVQNKRAYASKHGYDFIWADDEIDPTRPASWSKIPILKHYIQQQSYDFVMWIDMDAIITNFNVKIEHLVIVDDDKDASSRTPTNKQPHDLFFSRDHNDINGGIFIVRSTSWSIWWLDQVWDQTWAIQGNHPFEYEQRALHYIYGTERMNAHVSKIGMPLYPHRNEVRAKVGIVPSCAFNSNVCEKLVPSALLLYRAHGGVGDDPASGNESSGSGETSHFSGSSRSKCMNMYRTGDFILHLAGKKPQWYRNWLLLQFSEKVREENKAYFDGVPE